MLKKLFVSLVLAITLLTTGMFITHYSDTAFADGGDGGE